MRDFDIRLLLKASKLQKFLEDPDSRVVEELKIPVAQARIDLAVINGHLHGFEIKSAVDTLSRLPGQIQAYTKVFDYLSIVTEGKYVDKILGTLPGWISVYECCGRNGKHTIRLVRKGSINKNKEKFYLAKLLWRHELIHVLKSNNIPFRLKDGNWILAEILAAHLSIYQISNIVRLTLKQRAYWKIQS